MIALAEFAAIYGKLKNYLTFLSIQIPVAPKISSEIIQSPLATNSIR